MKLGELINYFRDLALNHKSIKTFIYLNEDRVDTLQKNLIQYPCFFLDEPLVMYEVEATDVKKFVGEFSVLAYCEKDNFSHQDYTIFETETIVNDLIGLLKTHSLVTGKFNCNIIKGNTTDNTYGWRVNYEIEVGQILCEAENFIDTTNFNEFIPQFTFENNVENGFDVLLTPIGTYDEVNFEVSFDSALYGKAVLTTHEFIDFSAQFYAFVVMTAKVGAVTKKCAAYIRKYKYAGESYVLLNEIQ